MSAPPVPASTDAPGSAHGGPLGLLGRHWPLLAVVAAHAALWTLANQVLSPHPDTIDHWVQSRIFSWGYYEHPPMVAWWLRGFTALLGSSEAALETSAQIANLGVIALAYGVAAWVFGRLAALFTVLMLEATLYFSAGSVVLQIDQPMMTFWLAALWSLLAYQRSRRPHWLLLMGVFAGLGGLSKYVMVLYYLGVGVYITVIPAARREWRNPWQWAGGVVALLVVSPLVIWNARHDWVSFRYQLGKAGSEGGDPFGYHTLNFTLGWLALFSVVLIVWGVWVLWPMLRREWGRDGPVMLLAVISATPLAFFSLILLDGSFSDPKWANVAFLGFYILLGGAAAERWRAGRRRGVLGALVGGHALNAALLAVVFSHIFWRWMPLEPSQDQTLRLLGWRETARAVEGLLEREGVPRPEYVVSMFYPLASQFALHMSNQPLTHSVERPERNLWSPLDRLTESNTLMVCVRNCDMQVPRVERSAELMLAPLGAVQVFWHGEPLREVGVYRVVATYPPPRAWGF